MRPLKERYKLAESAHQRAKLESGVAASEYKLGLRAKHFRYGVIEKDGEYRVVACEVKKFVKKQLGRIDT
jgi:hypothetical protein